MFLQIKKLITQKCLIICGITGVIFLITSAYLGYKVIPDFIDKKIWETKILKENTDQWEVFMKVPFAFTFKVYVFNVENPEEILEGAKPIVKEMGPYVYKLFRWKSEVVWNTTETLSYNDYTRFEFDAVASGDRSEQDEFTTLNSPYNSLLLTVEGLSPNALPTVATALPHVFNKYNSLFTKVKIKDYFFDGIRLCENGGKSGGFPAKMVCGQLMAKVKEAKPMRIVNGTVLFANFHFKNNTHQGRFSVKSGQGNPKEAGELFMYDEKRFVESWLGGENSTCNKIRGVTTSFPAGVTTDMVFDAFSEDVCRVMSMNFKQEETVKNVLGYKFSALNNSFDASINSSSCFCVNQTRDLDGSFGCLGNGLLDLSTCTGAPVLLSFPHLLYADKKYLNTVQGLNPTEKLHETFVVLEPTSGVPIKLAKRVQFNMFIRPIEGLDSIENITNALAPMFWVEESTTLGDEYIDLIKTQLLGNLHAFEIGRTVIIAISLITVIATFFLITYKQE